MNIEPLSLDQMRAALAVVQSGGFAAAARRLHRTQSAISYAVAELERQLGVPLFQRAKGRQPEPTEAGQVLIREMEVLVRQADALEAKARAVSHGLETDVRLAIDDHFPITALVPVLREVAARFPTVQVRLFIETMGAVSEAVLGGDAVLGILASVPNLPAGLSGDALPPISRIAVVSSTHALANGANEALSPSHADMLEHVQIVLSERREARPPRDYRVHGGRTWRVGDLYTKRMLLLAGLGWGYLPQHLIADDLREGRLRRLRVQGVRDRNDVAVLLVRRRDRLLGPATTFLLDSLLGFDGLAAE